MEVTLYSLKRSNNIYNINKCQWLNLRLDRMKEAGVINQDRYNQVKISTIIGKA